MLNTIMNILIVSIDHYLQLLEAETDSETLRASKLNLRKLLQLRIAGGNLTMIFEESSPTKSTIAAQLASQSDPEIPWRNIIMTEDERRAAGIFDALRNRPGHPDWDNMEYWIERRILEDLVREDFFVNQILEASDSPGDVLVLLGDMHVMPVADRLGAKGHTVEIRPELVPVKRWE
jgi:hypothetical protein